MRWVESATIRPNHCCMIPFVGSTNEAGFFDTGQDFREGDHAYVSVVFVREAARILGLVSPKRLIQQLDEAHVQIRELKKEKEELEERLEAVDILKLRPIEVVNS